MKRRRWLAGVTAAMMILGTIGTGTVSSQAAEPEVTREGLIAEYDLSKAPKDGITLKNLAGGETAAGDAVVHNEAVWENGGLVFDGKGTSNEAAGTWVELPDDILKGAASASVTIEAKADEYILNNHHFLWNIGNSGTDTYWFMHTRDYRTSIKYNGSEKTASGYPLEADRWYSFTSVIDAEAHTLTFYIDGVEVGKVTEPDLSLAQVSDQSRNTIGRAPYNDPMFRGAVASFRVYDRALKAGEVKAISDYDGKLHEKEFIDMVDDEIAKVRDITVDDSFMKLPDYNGMVTWKSETDRVVIAEDGVSASIRQPENGGKTVKEKLTAIVNLRGVIREKEVNITISPEAAPDDPYGYLLVHFVEDSQGYQEKIYLDISRGDNPEQWDPLNGRQPILVSNKNTTGARDPFITYNPETETFYIIATDLRVFGGDMDYYANVNYCWAEWSRVGSTLMNVWESKDLIHWSENRQIDMSLNADGEKVAELGMMWAPETTWVPDYYGEGKGAFVVYWSSNVFDINDKEHVKGSGGSNIVWGVTTDFTQDTFEYGGVFLYGGSAGFIDTSLIQANGKTYHVTKSHADGIIMESTTEKEWWKGNAQWTRIQSGIGASRFGGVEGPAVFKDHSKEDSFYLFVDDMPSPGYQPMYTTNLDAGWDYIDSADYFLTGETKHGGVISLTKAQYDALRAADAISAVKEDLDGVTVEKGTSVEDIEALLPETVEVNLAYERGTSKLPVHWDMAEVDVQTEGEYQVTGVVDTIGANKNQWVGANGSLLYNAPDKQLYSSTEITVTATVKIADRKELPYEDVKESDWFYNEVAYNYEKGLMTGMDPTHFGPYNKLARAQFALILYRMEGSPSCETTKTFQDVAGDEWYGPAILWAAEAGIVNGYENGYFGPADDITREQMAVMMYRYAKYLKKDTTTRADYSEFEDAANVTGFAHEAMQWAYGMGIIKGKDEGTIIDPQGTASRAETAIIIQRFME